MLHNESAAAGFAPLDTKSVVISLTPPPPLPPLLPSPSVPSPPPPVSAVGVAEVGGRGEV